MKTIINVSRISTIVIFLALIRCISEPFRLQHYSKTDIAFNDIRQFIVGALVAALGLFLMNLMAFKNWHKSVFVLGCLTFVSLLIVKWMYTP